MGGDNEEIYRRIASLEKEVYHVTRQLTNLEAEKPIQRIGLVELSLKQIAADLLSMEKISAEMSEKLSSGIDALKTQAAISAARMGWIIGAGVLTGGILSAWPTIKEILKAMVS